MAREPVRFTGLRCGCSACCGTMGRRPGHSPGNAPTPPHPDSAAPRPRTPEDGQRIHTPEGGKPITTRHAASGREVPNGADDRGPAGKD